VGLDKGQELVFGGYPTRDGFSFGPLISGKDVHFTVFVKEGFLDTHVTVKEAGAVRYIPILHEPELMFWRRLLEDFQTAGVNRPYDPNSDAYLLTRKGIRALEAAFQETTSVSVLKGTATVDIDFAPILDLAQNFDVNNLMRLRRAKELFNYPEVFRIGVTPEMESLHAKQGMLVTYPTSRESWTPLIERMFGFGEFIKYLEAHGLANSFIKSAQRCSGRIGIAD
jgi:hypothetical protein